MSGTMKAVLWTVAVVLCLSVGVYFAGCGAKDDAADGGAGAGGGGGGGGGGSGTCSTNVGDCAAYCQKELLCNPDENVADCTSGCETAVPNLQGAYVTTVMKCVDECTDSSTCEEEAASTCPVGNADVVATAMCEFMVGCYSGQMTMEQCMQEFSSGDMTALNCLCAAGVDKIKTCLKTATCGDEEATSNCISGAMGGGSSSGGATN